MSNCAANTLPLRRQKSHNLQMKHEILSPECDQFRVRSVRTRFTFRFGAVCFGMGLAIYALQMTVSLFTTATSALIFLSVLLGYLLRPIEERVLIVRSLGIQLTSVNGLHQEFSTFFPFESVASFYIFESFDGLKVNHFFNLKLKEKSRNVILFENLNPPVEFLKRLYRKINETKEGS